MPERGTDHHHFQNLSFITLLPTTVVLSVELEDGPPTPPPVVEKTAAQLIRFKPALRKIRKIEADAAKVSTSLQITMAMTKMMIRIAASQPGETGRVAGDHVIYGEILRVVRVCRRIFAEALPETRHRWRSSPLSE